MRWGGWRVPVLLVLVGLTAVACELSEGDGVSSEGGEPMDAARELLGDYLAALEARDTAAIRAAIRDDGRFAWLEDGTMRYWSVDAILTGLEAFPPEMPISTRTEEITVVPVGERGAHAWTGFTTMIGEGEGAYVFGGMLSFVLERGDDGWRVVGGHTSSAGER